MELSVKQVIAMLQEGLTFPLRSIATELEQEFDKLNKQVNEMRSQLAAEVLENGNLQGRIKCLEQKSIQDDETINELYALQAPVSDVVGYELPLKDCDDPECWCKRDRVIANLPLEEVGDEDLIEDDDALCDCAECRAAITGGCMADFDECVHGPGGAAECRGACGKDCCVMCCGVTLDAPCSSCGRWPEKDYADYDDDAPF